MPYEQGATSSTGSTLIEILISLVLILANGFFAASEMAVVSARRSQLERRGARRAPALAQQPEYFLATVGIGIELRVIAQLASQCLNPSPGYPSHSRRFRRTAQHDPAPGVYICVL